LIRAEVEAKRAGLDPDAEGSSQPFAPPSDYGPPITTDKK
jgi:hypothetical protein